LDSSVLSYFTVTVAFLPLEETLMRKNFYVIYSGYFRIELSYRFSNMTYVIIESLGEKVE